MTINNPDFGNYLVRCIQLSLRSRTRRRATLLLSTWIYCCGWTVSFALPFTTNVTISTFISQIFNSWVAIFHLGRIWHFISHFIRYARACSSYECFVLMAKRFPYKLFRARICQGKFEIVSYEVLWSSCYMTFLCITIFSYTLHWSDIAITCDRYTELNLTLTWLSNFESFLIYANHQRSLSLLDTLSCQIWDIICMCSNVETILLWTCHVSALWVSNIPRYFYFSNIHRYFYFSLSPIPSTNSLTFCLPSY